MQTRRRELLQAAGASVLMTSVFQRAFAQAVPEMATFVTGFAAGGTSDNICRRMAQKMQPGYARSLVVENRTGASGQIAVSYVKGRPADGTTILQTPLSILSVYPYTYKKLPYDPVSDLTPVSLGCVLDFALAVGPAVPASVKSVPDYLRWVKANPDKASFGSPAAGATAHFMGMLLGNRQGTPLTHIAYRGTQPAMLDLLGGNVPAVMGPIGDIIQHLATGKVRVLGLASTKRSPFAPDVPTFEEQGIADMVHNDWFAFFLPAKASPDVVDRLNVAIRGALAQQDVIASLNTFGLDVKTSTPGELGDLLKRDLAKWAAIVKQVGFTAVE